MHYGRWAAAALVGVAVLSQAAYADDYASTDVRGRAGDARAVPAQDSIYEQARAMAESDGRVRRFVAIATSQRGRTASEAARTLASGVTSDESLRSLLPSKAAGGLSVAQARAMLAAAGADETASADARALQAALPKPVRSQLVEARADLTALLDAGAPLVDDPGVRLVDDVAQWDAVAPKLADTVRGYGVGETVLLQARQRRTVTLADLRDAGLSLRRRFTGPGAAEGADFSFTRDLDADQDSFATEFCVAWKPSVSWTSASGRTEISGNLVFAVAGDLSSSRDHAENVIEAYAGADLTFNFAASEERWFFDRRTKRLQTTLVLHHMRTQDASIEETTAQLVVTPRIGALALGVRRGHENIDYATSDGIDAKGCCCVPDNIVSWQWGLVGNFAAGTRDEDGRDSNSYFSASGELSGRIYFDALGRKLNGDPWDTKSFPFLEARWTGWYQSADGTDTHDLVELSFVAPLGPVLRLQALYSNGFDEDLGRDQEMFRLSLSAYL